MFKSVLAISMALGSAFTLPAVAGPKPHDKSVAVDPADKEAQQKLKEHMKLREQIMRVKFPATRASACKGMKGIKASDLKWVEETLADKTYYTAEEIMIALGWDVLPQEQTKK